MVFNVIDPAHSRYIVEEGDLEKFLKDKYGKDYPDFNYEISHECDRWSFEAPELVDEDEINRLINDIEAKAKKP